MNNPSLKYVLHPNQQRPRLKAVGSSSGSSSTLVASGSSRSSKARSHLTVPPTPQRQEERRQSPVVQTSPHIVDNASSGGGARRRNQQQHPIQNQPLADASNAGEDRRVFFLSNAAGSNTNYQNNNPRYHIRSVESVIQEPSYIQVGRRRHLMESKGALNIPPVATILCVVNLTLYLFREPLFEVTKEEHVHVSWDLVWNRGEYWRLFLAQFFHFNRLSVIANSFTLFTIGRYLERKVTTGAMVVVIIVMSALSHFLYILIGSYCLHRTLCCKAPQYSESVSGFGNVIFSLRVLLAYALEPRNYERDLVFGLYPMVVSATHAPWQPLLELFIFKLVLPEQCITGQISGILAGFFVTAILLLWPTEGIYTSRPPSHWTPFPNDQNRSNRDSNQEAEVREDRGDRWRTRTSTDSNFWVSTSSHTIDPPSPSESEVLHINLDFPQRNGNALQRKSDNAKMYCKEFIKHPAQSVLKLAKSLVAITGMKMEEDERKKQIRMKEEEQRQQKQHQPRRVNRFNRNYKSKATLVRKRNMNANKKRRLVKSAEEIYWNSYQQQINTTRHFEENHTNNNDSTHLDSEPSSSLSVSSSSSLTDSETERRFAKGNRFLPPRDNYGNWNSKMSKEKLQIKIQTGYGDEKLVIQEEEDEVTIF